jgi:glycine hydroxymethyltransferase
MTSRGFKEAEMKQIAELIELVLKNPEDQETLTSAHKQVLALTGRFPLYPERG